MNSAEINILHSVNHTHTHTHEHLKLKVYACKVYTSNEILILSLEYFEGTALRALYDFLAIPPITEIYIWIICCLMNTCYLIPYPKKVKSVCI